MCLNIAEVHWFSAVLWLWCLCMYWDSIAPIRSPLFILLNYQSKRGRVWNWRITGRRGDTAEVCWSEWRRRRKRQSLMQVEGVSLAWQCIKTQWIHRLLHYFIMYIHQVEKVEVPHSSTIPFFNSWGWRTRKRSGGPAIATVTITNVIFWRMDGKN